MEANPTTDAKPTPGKFVQFGLNTAAITDLATEFLKPEKLTPFLQEHKSPPPANPLPSHTALTNL